MGQNESALPDNEYGLMVLNNTVSFNVNDCPNPNQIKVQKGLLSFPSGKLEPTIDARKRSILGMNFYSNIAFKVMHRIHLEYSTSSTGNFQLGDITNFDLE